MLPFSSFLPVDVVLSVVVSSVLCFWLRKRYVYNQKCFWKLRPRLGRPALGASVETIRILSQNMWCTNSWGAEKKGSKGPEVRKRFDALVRAAVDGKYDVLLLQELFAYRLAYFFLTIEEVVYLTGQLEAAGFVYHTDLAYNLPVMIGQSSGVAIFSRYPISEWSGHTFGTHSLKDSLNAKGFVHAEIGIGQRSVHFYSTHLDSSRAQPDVKTKQVKQLVQDVSKMVAGETAVVGGDFNICSRQPLYRSLYSHLLSTMNQVGMETAFSDLAYTHRGGGVLDHMFIGGGIGSHGDSGGLALRNISARSSVHLESGVAGIPVSDHDGLSVTLRLC